MSTAPRVDSARALGVFLTLTVATGCYCSHGRTMARDGGTDGGQDGGVLPDVGAPADAGVDSDAERGSSDYWVLERREAELLASRSPACGPVAGSSAVVRVHVPIRSECEYGGPITTTQTDGGAVITAHVWVRVPTDGSSCAPVSAIVERHALLRLAAGSRRVVTDDGGSELQLVVQPAPASECGSRSPGQTCASDCDCWQPTFVCLPSVDESGACRRVCGQPCDLHNGPRPALYGAHFDCQGQSCRQLEDMGAPTCQPFEGVGCHEAGCPRGLSCASSEATPQACGWGRDVFGGGGCTDGRDCSPGRVCVERGGSRSCQEPCFTNWMPCSAPGSQCLQLGPNPSWVCAHVGP